jgi:Dockerin type I domain
MKEIKILLSFIVLVLAAVNSYSADTRWFGNGQNWSNTDYWVGGLEPTSAHSSQIDGTVVVTLAGEVVGKNLYIGYSSGDDAKIDIISGDLTVSDSAQTTFIGRSGKGTLEISGGTLLLTAFTILGSNLSGEGICKVDGGFFNASGLRVGEDGRGTITQTNGIFDASVITLGDSDGSFGTYEISGGTLSASAFRLGPNRFRTAVPTFDIQSNTADITFTADLSFYSANSVFMAVPNSKIKMAGEYADFINELDTANEGNVSGLENLTMEFSDNSTATYCSYEVACEDLDPNAIGYCGGNFTLDTLAVGGDTPSKVGLVDNYDNGNRGGGSECLYVRKLIVTAGSSLDLNGFNLYYQEAEVAGTVSGGTPQKIHMETDIDGSGVVDIEDVRIIAENWLSTGCSCPSYCSGADVNLDGVVDLYDLAMIAMDWLDGGGGGGGFWSETFDSDPAWSTQGEWAFGTPTGSGGSSVPSGYGNPDPASGYTGSNVYGINLSGNYSSAATGTYQYLTTPVIDCTGHFNVELRFYRWLNTDLPNYVPASIAISNNGSIWHPIWYNIDEGSGALTDSDWSQKVYDVSAYADNSPTFQIRWGHWVKTGAYEYSGWNIDDIELWENP